MDKILSFGGGLQTTALAVMIARGELDVDGAEGIQFEFGYPEEYSCWSGYCSH